MTIYKFNNWKNTVEVLENVRSIKMDRDGFSIVKVKDSNGVTHDEGEKRNRIYGSQRNFRFYDKLEELVENINGWIKNDEIQVNTIQNRLATYRNTLSQLTKNN